MFVLICISLYFCIYFCIFVFGIFVFVHYQRWGWGWDGGTDGLKSGFLPPRSTSSSPPRNFTTSCENTFDCITIFLVRLTCDGIFNVDQNRYILSCCTFLQWGHSIAGKDSVSVKSALLPLPCSRQRGYFCITVERWSLWFNWYSSHLVLNYLLLKTIFFKCRLWLWFKVYVLMESFYFSDSLPAHKLILQNEPEKTKCRQS